MQRQRAIASNLPRLVGSIRTVYSNIELIRLPTLDMLVFHFVIWAWYTTVHAFA
jgi:hypothetical protein